MEIKAVHRVRRLLGQAPSHPNGIMLGRMEGTLLLHNVHLFPRSATNGRNRQNCLDPVLRCMGRTTFQGSITTRIADLLASLQ